MIKYTYILFLLTGIALSISPLQGQGYWFGVKGGGAMNNQRWGSGNNFGAIQNDPLFSGNADIFIESIDELKKGALYAALGYHIRGSSIRYLSFNQNFSNVVIPYKFRNAVVELGAKKSLQDWKNMSPYFILGIRGEYTLSHNLNDVFTSNTFVFPEYINKWNYGVTLGGGVDRNISEFINVFLEFSIQPDISVQYDQPPLGNLINPWTNEPTSLSQEQVRNVSMELKLGIKFLRKVIYID